MKNSEILKYFLMVGFLLEGCSSSSTSPIPPPTLKGEYIYRRQGDALGQADPMIPQKRIAYPWEEERNCAYPKITKDFFRCNGSGLNPPHLMQKKNEVVRYFDCGGQQKHSLPLRDQKEFIYPILIDLLNEVQTKTGKRVVITCGHCCPEHNAYLDPSPANQTSKHLLGAEVDFYVQGMEEQPEKVVEIILAYYREQPKYQGQKEYVEFQRYEKEDTNVTIAPWYNKEIFIKLFKKGEGRDLDNRHPYPYVSVQARYDWDLQEKVNYSWDKAFRNFHRW